MKALQCAELPFTRQRTMSDRVNELKNRLGAHSKRFDSLRADVEDMREERRALERDLKAMSERIEAVEAKIARLDNRTELLNLVQSSDEMNGEQRSTALVQHLYKKAQKRRDRGEHALASVNRDEAEAALQYPTVDRTTIYRDMERAVRLVDNEAVLTYERASGDEKRLKLNLETDELPARFTDRTEL